jgi:hypothetical protein
MAGLVFVSSWAGVGTLVAAGAAAVSALAAVVMAKRNRRQVVEIHAIVNSTMTDLVARTEQLVRSIQAQGGEIPATPVTPAEGERPAVRP